MLVKIEVSNAMTIHIGMEDIVHYIEIEDGQNYCLIEGLENHPIDNFTTAPLGVHYSPRENMGPFWVSSIDDGNYDEEYDVSGLLSLLPELEKLADEFDIPLRLEGAVDTCGITIEDTVDGPCDVYDIHGVATGEATVLAYVKAGTIVVAFQSDIEWDDPGLKADITIPQRALIKYGMLMMEGSTAEEWFKVGTLDEFNLAVVSIIAKNIRNNPMDFQEYYKLTLPGQRMMISTMTKEGIGEDL